MAVAAHAHTCERGGPEEGAAGRPPEGHRGAGGGGHHAAR